MINPRLRKYMPMVPVVLLLAAAIWVVAMSQPYLPLGSFRIRQEKEAIARTSRSIEQALSSNQALANELSALAEIRDYAIQLPDKAAAVLFRERLEKGISEAGLRTRTMGDVRKIDIAENIFLFEVTFSADGQIGELTRLMDTLYRDKPRVYWKNITIKPNALTQPEFISVTATLSALGFVPDDSALSASDEALEAVPESETVPAETPAAEDTETPEDTP